MNYLDYMSKIAVTMPHIFPFTVDYHMEFSFNYVEFPISLTPTPNF